MSELEKQQSQAAEAETTESSLLDQIMEQANISRSDESYDVASKGVQAFILEMLKSSNKDERVRKALIDEMISEVDKKLGVQMDAILHNESFQKMESAWRGLKFLVDRTDFRENNKINILNVSKEDMEIDFEDASEISESGLYKKVYTEEYGNFGGEPYSSIIANYEFDHSSPDIKLMQSMMSVGAMAHAPVIAAASPKFFGVDNIEDLPKLNDIASIFEGPQYAKWRSLRESEDARYLGLTMPRFLLRLPYDSKENPVKAFNYNETINEDHERYCWGNTSFALASKLTDSFAKYRWCPNIIGPQSGGSMEDLPLHQYETMGQLETKIPTEVLVSDRREFELAEAGFIPLTFRKGSDNAAFFSANSIQKPKFFGISKEGKEAETNYKLGTQLPYMYVVNRLAHYIKVLQRENIGSTKERLDIQDELNVWIRQFVADQDGASAEVRARRPLRSAEITVDDVEGEPGFYKVGMKVRPHFKYMGADFTLSLVGKLDK
ncbi:type VI secretion system contractile sheath large subunit [Aestuariibacter salexigens]|uniref:type VI secretion system contractile sheath large subunit n=1 Tax=Aestuariibacter salexigens TaxID=226010 RepID=UPI00041024BD|nr:type VI secretion system contractile sheath large subunit [Aestuariibacter salexigens]